MGGGIMEVEFSGDGAGAPVIFSCRDQCQKGRSNELNNPHQVSPLEFHPINSNLEKTATGVANVKNYCDRFQAPNMDSSQCNRLTDVENRDYPTQMIDDEVSSSWNFDKDTVNTVSLNDGLIVDKDKHQEANMISSSNFSFDLRNHNALHDNQNTDKDQRDFANVVELSQSSSRLNIANCTAVSTMNPLSSQQQGAEGMEQGQHIYEDNGTQPHIQSTKTNAGMTNPSNLVNYNRNGLKSIGTHLQIHANEHRGTAAVNLMQGIELDPIKAHNNQKDHATLSQAVDPKQSQQQQFQKHTPSHPTYPKVSSNFDELVPNDQRNNLLPNQTQTRDNNNQTIQKNQFPSKKDQVPQPAPYTVIQTFATKLRLNQAKNEVPIELSTPTFTTKQGLPAVIFNKEDFMVKLAARCKFTLVGKFSNTMPKIELIRRSFILQTQLCVCVWGGGGVKIAHFNAKHVYIDLDNEMDYITVWTKQGMTIEGQIMRIQTWTPTFRPEEETPIVPIWVALLELPWHCYNKEFVTALLAPIGKVLYLDTASIQKTRGSIEKVRVQVNLTKERPPHVWMGYDKEDTTIGRWQAIQYENVPEYCMHCKHQGHMIHVCTVKKREEEQKRRKELEAEKKNKNKEGMTGKNQEAIQISEAQNKSNTLTADDHPQHHPTTDNTNEELWQTQKKKHAKEQNNTQQNNLSRPTSLQEHRKFDQNQQKHSGR
ncbi:uncharacterized protein LOC129870518 [Solanum dulcamara]|uniref:uncharacterized protein LOC129870518 n=1 Tax=Solanum dulcamara TaxID=45834 RepID=UPI002486AB81|nr:uncharacterized protein LOC129870518 [Solanum dulcamara]